MKRLLATFQSFLKNLFLLIIILLPWNVKRVILELFKGYKIHPTCKIGFSWVFPQELIMKSEANISHFNVIKGMEKLYLGNNSFIGKGNWISGYPKKYKNHYQDQQNRQPELIIGNHSAITNAHIIDCTDSVVIGQFTTIAGYGSQLLTHSIDLNKCRQWSEPIKIGDYCFIGTNAVLLGGSSLPDYSILGAKSLLNKSLIDRYSLYTGVPAEHKKYISSTSGYFVRKNGYVI